jgi:hypothetical protein
MAYFTAVFGGPGLHGYGAHTLSSDRRLSSVVIEGSDEFHAIVGKSKHCIAQPDQVHVSYDRAREIVTVKLVQPANHRTLDSMLQRKKPRPASKTDNSTEVEGPTVPAAELTVKESAAPAVAAAAGRASPDRPNVVWACRVCTLEHHGEEQRRFLACSICGAERRGVRMTL